MGLRLAIITVLVHDYCVSAQTVFTATISNATGDYFYVDDSTRGKQITCPASKGCYIHCRGASACGSALISSSSSGSPAWLHLECTASSACSSLSLDVASSSSANIICSSAGTPCSSASFSLSTTPTVSILCDNQAIDASWFEGACYRLNVEASYATDFNMNCVGNFSCYGSGENAITVSSATSAAIYGSGQRALDLVAIQAQNAGRLEVTCDGTEACYQGRIYPPYDREYAFRLRCDFAAYSCWSMVVNVIASNGVYADNYMEAICPTNNTLTGVCDVRIVCQSGVFADLDWLDANTRFECDPASACCPWSDPDNMLTSMPTTSPSPAPTMPPTELTSSPSSTPTSSPSGTPTSAPTQPSVSPTDQPSKAPSEQPTVSPSDQPSEAPSEQPTPTPTDEPTLVPSDQPSNEPSNQPSNEPSDQPSNQPSPSPTSAPIADPNPSKATVATQNALYLLFMWLYLFYKV